MTRGSLETEGNEETGRPSALVLIDAAAKIATILIPFMILYLGQRYTTNQDRANAAQKAADRVALVVRHLASPEPRERLLAVTVVRSLAKNEQFPADLAEVLVQIASTDSSIEVVRAASEVVDTAARSDTQLGTLVNEATTSLPARVYFHIREESQREAARALQQRLEARDLVVPGIQRLDVGPEATELRFFKREDRPEAEELIRRFAQAGQTVVLSDLSAKYQDSAEVGRRQFELWLAKE